MTYYTGVVDRGGEGFGIWFPDLPGCTSGGRDEENLFAMAIEAVALWAEGCLSAGKPVPPPRGFDAVCKDAEVIEAQREDHAVLIQVPLLIEHGRPVRANLSVDSGTLKAIDDAAARNGQTRSAYMVGATLEKIRRA